MVSCMVFIQQIRYKKNNYKSKTNQNNEWNLCFALFNLDSSSVDYEVDVFDPEESMFRENLIKKTDCIIHHLHTLPKVSNEELFESAIGEWMNKNEWMNQNWI